MSRPYFGTEIVKVKKERPKHKYFTTQKIDGKLYGFYYNKKYKMDIHIEEIKKKSKGNWVNGENLDKIKFPVPCSYIYSHIKYYGMLNKGFDDAAIYELHNIDKQHKNTATDCNREFKDFSLRNLIEKRNIHILKGKIIIYEEEK